MRRLRSEIENLEARILALAEELRRTSYHRSCEQAVNMEAIDLLRFHGIRYRPGLDMSKWPEDMRE